MSDPISDRLHRITSQRKFMTSSMNTNVKRDPLSTYVSRLPKVGRRTRCLLFTLPLELRVMIYEYVFSSEDPLRPIHFHVHDQIVIQCMFKESWEAGSSMAALLCTCRSIHDEAVGVLYNSTRFEVALYRKQEAKCTTMEHTESGSCGSRLLGKLSDYIRSFKRMGSMFIDASTPEGDIQESYLRIELFLDVIEHATHPEPLVVRLKYTWSSKYRVLRNTGLGLEALYGLLRKPCRFVTIHEQRFSIAAHNELVADGIGSFMRFHDPSVVEHYFSNVNYGAVTR